MRILAILLLALAGVSACNHKQRVPGQLIVAIDTDMSLPEQIDTIELQVIINGTTRLDNPMPVGHGLDTQPIPATLTLVAGPDPTLPVTIRVLGQKNSITRTLRQVITTVPPDRIVTLRMPVQWLCDGTAQPVGQVDGKVVYESTCGSGATCKAGKCVVADVISGTLEDYRAQSIFGGAAAPAASEKTVGACFDTVPCMVGGALAMPDDQCTIPVPGGDATGVNVALRVANDGICDTSGTTCFVPLDGNSPEGWAIQSGRIALPAAVCTKLRTGLVAGVVTSTACPTKTMSNPPCGSWSSVMAAVDASMPSDDGGPAAPVAPIQVATTAPDAGTSSVCCPLTADGSKLYTCLCDGTSSVRVVSVDATTGSTGDVATFTPKYVRSRYAAVLAGGNLYWADRMLADGGDACPIYATPAAGGAAAAIGSVSGDIYDGADLLADAAAVYALADNVSGLAASASPVQVVRVDRSSGAITAFDAGGSLPVLQFTQDATSLYAGVDTDVGGDGGVERVSRIVKMAKTGGGSSKTLVQRTLTTSDTGHGGFIGLADDGTTLFALYEAAAGGDGTIDTQVMAVDASTGNTTPLYRESVDPTVVRIRLLGAVSGSILLVRDGTGAAGAGASSAESAVLAIPPGGGAPRIVASFSHDTPLFALQAPTFSPDVFWINANGGVFRLPAAALR